MKRALTNIIRMAVKMQVMACFAHSGHSPHEYFLGSENFHKHTELKTTECGWNRILMNNAA